MAPDRDPTVMPDAPPLLCHGRREAAGGGEAVVVPPEAVVDIVAAADRARFGRGALPAETFADPAGFRGPIRLVVGRLDAGAPAALPVTGLPGPGSCFSIPCPAPREPGSGPPVPPPACDTGRPE